MIGAVEDIFVESEWDDRKQDVALAWQLQGVYCMSKNNVPYVANMPPMPGNEGNNAESYYIYGGIAGGMFAVVVVFGVCFYRQRSKVMEKELRGIHNDFYGTIVNTDERSRY
eukprot:UN10159